MPAFFRPVLFLALALTTACHSWKDAAWVTRGEAGAWSVEVPDFLVESTTLHPNAPLQLHAPEKDFFLVVRHDPLNLLTTRQPDFVLEDFLDLSIERLIEGLAEPKVPKASPGIVNGLPSHQATITGYFRGESLVYELVLVKGRTRMYQLLIWLPEEKYAARKDAIERMMNSFREEGM